MIGVIRSKAWIGSLVARLVRLFRAIQDLGWPPSGLRARYAERRRQLLAGPPPDGIVTEADLSRLPPLLAGYLRRSGAVGRARIDRFHARVHGRIRSSPDAEWMPFTGHQLNRFDPEPQRLFLIAARRSGLPVTVFHDYRAGSATMRGRLAGLIPVLDASRPELDRSETVTMLNDLVVFAPAALVDAPIAWKSVDAHTVRARYSVSHHSVGAELRFDDDGDLVDFTSLDRARASADGRSFTAMPWSTPLRGYRESDGRRAATGGEGRWHAPEGTYTYLDFVVDGIDYNAGLDP